MMSHIRVNVATDEKPNDSGEMEFKLLMKRGHKQMVKDLKVPLDSELALGLKDTQMVNIPLAIDCLFKI